MLNLIFLLSFSENRVDKRLPFKNDWGSATQNIWLWYCKNWPSFMLAQHLDFPFFMRASNCRCFEDLVCAYCITRNVYYYRSFWMESWSTLYSKSCLVSLYHSTVYLVQTLGKGSKNRCTSDLWVNHAV